MIAVLALVVAQAQPVTPSASTMNPDIALLVDVAAAAFSKDEPFQSGEHDPHGNGFTLQQAELSLGKSVDPYFRLDSFIVFGGDHVELEEAYATTLALPGNLQVRAGQFLTRIGRVNPTHPHGWDFVDQPLILGRLFGGEGNRGPGLEASWLAPLPWFAEIIASSNKVDPDGTVRSPLDLQNSVILKQFFPLSDAWSLLWGMSSAFGPDAQIYGGDLYLKFRPLGPSHTMVALQTEWYVRRRQVPDDTVEDGGGYASLVWRFARRWGLAGRYERVADIDRVGANVTFWPSEFSRLRLQGSTENADGERGWAGFLAFEVVIGAHGAHPF